MSSEPAVQKSSQESNLIPPGRKSILNYPREEESFSGRGKEALKMSQKEEVVRYELHHVDLWPIIRAAFVLFSIVGLVVGLFAFLVFPPPSSATLSFSTRLLSAVLFAFLYTLIITFGFLLILWLYNLLAVRFNWRVAIHLSQRSTKS